MSGDGECDADEPTTVTNSDGTYVIPMRTAYDKNDILLMDTSNGDCMDAVTGLPISMPLRSFASATVMTPLTTVRSWLLREAALEPDVVDTYENLISMCRILCL